MTNLSRLNFDDIKYFEIQKMFLGQWRKESVTIIESQEPMEEEIEVE